MHTDYQLLLGVGMGFKKKNSYEIVSIFIIYIYFPNEWMNSLYFILPKKISIAHEEMQWTLSLVDINFVAC